MRRLVLIFVFILAVFSLPALAITELEFKQICRSNSVHELKTLIANEKNFANIRFHEMDTPLIIAAKKAKNPEILRLIIAAGVDVNARNEDGETALLEIMDESVSFECVKVLLENGANPNLADEDGETPLMKALDDDLPADIIEALLDAGSNVKARDRKGRGILHYARKAYGLHGTATMQRIESLAK